jgi:hypothetical protein
MSSDNENPHPRSRRRQRKSKNPLPWFLAVLLITAGILVYFLYFEKSLSLPSTDLNPLAVEDNAKIHNNSSQPETPSLASHDQPAHNNTDNDDTSATKIENSSDEAETIKADDIDLVDQEMIAVNSEPLGQVEPGSENATKDVTCQPAIVMIKDFYAHLDEQEYLVPYQLDKPSEQYFSSLLQKVVNNPPIVTGETDDLFNILQNTAHFFRIVGKKNIFTLKAILDREKDSFENVLSEFYKLTGSPTCLSEAFGLQIPESALYDYAGFFLNTMGGRLYLFRRDSVSRLAVSYYSILIVDRANNNGTNKHGIDLAPAIRSLIDELENSGSRLRLRDDYLDMLYNLEEKYL